MLSIVMVARNVRPSAALCVQSLLHSIARLRMESQVEFLFVDDASDPGQETEQVMLQYRQQTKVPLKVLKFTARQHYTRALAQAFSIVSGQTILFVSHDMIVTPAYIKTLLAVAALDSSIGIVRGTSPYVDCFPQHVIKPPVQPVTMDDVMDFSDFVARAHGLEYVEDRLLTGDSMLILPAALQKVGVFDPRYFGYFGDIDFGLRVQRAGLKMICAKGAWLLHEGAAFYRHQAAGKELAPVHQARMKVVGEAYRVFRDKWSSALPPEYPGSNGIDFDLLRTVPVPTGGEFVDKILPDTAVSQML